MLHGTICLTSYMAKYKYLYRVADALTSKTGMALNNVPETVKLLVDQCLLDGNFADPLQIFWETFNCCNEAYFLTGYPEENLGLK